MKKQGEQSKRVIKDKRFYTYTAFALTAAVLAIVVIVTAAAVAKKDSVTVSTDNGPSASAPVGGNQGGEVVNPDVDKPTEGVDFEDFLLPVESVSVSNDYGFFHNQTLNNYYEHVGVDFVAEEGTQVLASQEGTVESIYTSDLLSGTEITVDHGNGVKSVYRFVNAVEGLKAGDSVARGQVIATVSEATGDEYKDGSHLHFEILVNGENVDPNGYLTLEEK
ncbi:MAG: M23 family metallopeptidase [Clostridia bacterium]|nr:M23 family metallopeptidase [Clostridia bacterium]